MKSEASEGLRLDARNARWRREKRPFGLDASRRLTATPRVFFLGHGACGDLRCQRGACEVRPGRQLRVKVEPQLVGRWVRHVPSNVRLSRQFSGFARRRHHSQIRGASRLETIL